MSDACPYTRLDTWAGVTLRLSADMARACDERPRNPSAAGTARRKRRPPALAGMPPAPVPKRGRPLGSKDKRKRCIKRPRKSDIAMQRAAVDELNTGAQQGKGACEPHGACEPKALGQPHEPSDSHRVTINVLCSTPLERCTLA